jgi:hypothetical protein
MSAVGSLAHPARKLALKQLRPYLSAHLHKRRRKRGENELKLLASP